MTYKRSSIFFTALLFFLLQHQSVQTMENQSQPSHSNKLSIFNPLSWVYGLYSSFYYNFGWMTDAACEEKITASFNKLEKFIQVMFADILDGNHSFAQQILEDGKNLHDILNSTTINVQDLKLFFLGKIQSLEKERQITNAIFEKTINDLRKTLQRFSKTRQTVSNLEKQFSIYSQLTQEEIEQNNQSLSSLGEKYKDKIKSLYRLQEKHHKEHQIQVSQLQSQQQDFYQQTTESLKAVQQTTQQCQEECEKKQDKGTQEGETILELLQKIRENDVALQKVLNILPNSTNHVQATPKKSKQKSLNTSVFPNRLRKEFKVFAPPIGTSIYGRDI